MKLQFPTLPQSTEVQQEAIEILIKQMGIGKATIFFSEMFWKRTDYLEIKDRLFAGETVASLYEKVLLWREQNS
jgi:hypothetical protein